MKSIFDHRITDKKARRVRQYLNFVSGVKRATYYINTDGLVIELDDNAMVRNKKLIGKGMTDYVFFKDHEDLLKQAFIYADYDQDNEYLEVQVWSENLLYMATSIKVLQRLAANLNVDEIRFQRVIDFRRGVPLGEVNYYQIDDLNNLIRRVSTFY